MLHASKCEGDGHHDEEDAGAVTQLAADITRPTRLDSKPSRLRTQVSLTPGKFDTRKVYPKEIFLPGKFNTRIETFLVVNLLDRNLSWW